MPLSLITHPDGLHRCSWCGQGELFTDYIRYHDQEWGVPVKDESRLFEKICLEGFQAGLSWITVLRKRERFRELFVGFDPAQVADFSAKDVDRLLGDAGIIRHRGKIESTINNARRVLELQRDGQENFARLIWSFEPQERTDVPTAQFLMTQTQTFESQAMSKALRKLGFSFVGPTTMYAMMQSIGMINDHLEGCSRRLVCDQLRERFKRP
jgi:DNA-3-methyladenine glycosylase I